jgi:hypothetical protein
MDVNKDVNEQSKSNVKPMDGSYQVANVAEIKWNKNGNFTVLLDVKSEDGLPIAVNMSLDMFMKALDKQGF